MKATQIIVNGQAGKTYRSLTDAKKAGKFLIWEFKRNSVLGGINIQYKFV